jgi:hypothetical protein
MHIPWGAKMTLTIERCVSALKISNTKALFKFKRAFVKISA